MRAIVGFLLGWVVVTTPLRAADVPKLQEWKVGDTTRAALVYIPPPAKTDSPVVFAFHGHGGTMKHAAEHFAYHKHWPEAIVVYMQGLPTPGITDPEGKKSGWQRTPGDQSDRDLQFFDAVLAALQKEHKVDTKRIYATGHSNGGGFTYLLWAARGEHFAAVAPTAAGPGLNFKDLKPKPVLHLAGEKDQIVPFTNQKRTMDFLRKLNETEATGKEWGTHCTLYSSKSGPPVVTYIHPGGHVFPEDAPRVIVKFFKEQTKK